MVFCIYCSFSSAQNVGIGTKTPGSGLELKGPGLGSQQRITDAVSGNSLVLQGGAGGNLHVTGYNYATSAAQSLYLSVDGANTLINPNGGNVGIGITAPSTKLTVNSVFYGIEHTDGVRSLATFLNSAGGWIGTRSNHPLHFYTNDGSQQMTLTQSGQVGIGTTTPQGGDLLDVAGPIRSFGNTTHFVAQTTGGANSWARLYMRGPAQSWFIGTSQNFNGNQLYVGDETNNQTRLSIQPAGGPIYMQGNTTQDLGGYGFPKAMVFLNGDGTIIRCYNGLNGATSGGCGFSTGRVINTGVYYVIFPFDISARFFSISVENQCCSSQVVVSFQRVSSTRLDIINTLGSLQTTDRPVMVIVY